QKTIQELRAQIAALRQAQKASSAAEANREYQAPASGQQPAPATAAQPEAPTPQAPTGSDRPTPGAPQLPTGTAPISSAPPPLPVQDARLDIYGFAMLDTGYNAGTIDPLWFDVVRPTKLPSFPLEFGHNGHWFTGVRQSRLGFKGYLPTSHGEIRTIFEFE